MSLIRMEHVAKFYQSAASTDRAYALRDFSLVVDCAESVALMGPSGSGKSTVLNLLGALDTASEGLVIVDEQKLDALSTQERGRYRNEKVGFIFQSFNLLPVLTALENVLLPAQLSIKRYDQNQLTSRASSLLEKMQMGDFLHRRAYELSGGQMQRVAIARALINQPKIILADEPTANLDHDTSQIILDLLQAAVRESGTTLLIATHDEDVLRICQRVVRMRFE